MPEPAEAPPALGAPELRRYQRLERASWLLDNAVRIPFTRFRIGLDPLLGLVPGVGDAIGAAISGWIVVEAARFGVSRSMLLRMLGNIAMDTIVGSVPGIGDLFDFAWKSDAMNLALLRRHLGQPEKARAPSRRLVAAVLIAVLLLAVAAVVGAAFLVRYLAGLSHIL
ncbi:MAG TPA: DUF4112 domain-containing protein [Gemmatimonadales bacterium]|nr:DUF4112 domain-containing protein [Gemmatimonadales bacterium]